MYRNQYNQFIEWVKTAAEYSKDYENYQRCKQVLRKFDREVASKCLQDMFREYRLQIEACGQMEGRKLFSAPLETFSDNDLQWQMTYIYQRIPIYAVMRKMEKETAKRVCEWLEQQQPTFY